MQAIIDDIVTNVRVEDIGHAIAFALIKAIVRCPHDVNLVMLFSVYSFAIGNMLSVQERGTQHHLLVAYLIKNELAFTQSALNIMKRQATKIINVFKPTDGTCTTVNFIIKPMIKFPEHLTFFDWINTCRFIMNMFVDRSDAETYLLSVLKRSETTSPCADDSIIRYLSRIHSKLSVNKPKEALSEAFSLLLSSFTACLELRKHVDTVLMITHSLTDVNTIDISEKTRVLLLACTTPYGLVMNGDQTLQLRRNRWTTKLDHRELFETKTFTQLEISARLLSPTNLTDWECVPTFNDNVQESFECVKCIKSLTNNNSKLEYFEELLNSLFV
jgi:hypothetical protein